MKKVLIIIGIIVIVALGIYFGIVGGADGIKSIFVSDDNALNEKVADVLLASSDEKYLEGETKSEGHIILSSEVEGDLTTVYALTMYGEYGFQDGNFVKVSGTGVMPAVIKIFEKDGKVILTNIIWPKDGTGHEESLKEMFPIKHHARVLSISDNDRDTLKAMEIEYAKDYLTQIGRTAQIGEYGDFEHTLLTEAGVSVEVSNKLVEKNYANYPSWIGNQEKIEDGVRYIYQMDYDKENNKIVLSKSNYETKEVTEKIVIDSLTGEEI